MDTLFALSFFVAIRYYSGEKKFRNKFDSGKKYGLEFFTAAGMQLCTLMKVVKTTGRIQQLKPDNEELSLLASIG